MAIIKSSKKRIQIAKRNRKRNLEYLKKIRETRKEVEAAKSKKEHEKALNKAYKAIDKAAKKNIIHANKAARLKSKLAQKQS
jgi:small subunit ribosomal protein S20